MSKNSLLEVDFEHLAWKPVDPSITDSLPGSIKPLEMARGKNDVYVKAEWVAETKSQIDELKAFKQIFDYIDDGDGVKDGLSSTFVPFVDKNFGNPDVAPAPAKKETKAKEADAPKKDKESIDDILNDMDLDNLEPDEDIENIDIDNHPDLQAPEDIQDYSPETKYDYYVINEANVEIDSGWKTIDSANARLASIEGNGGEGYSVEKYSTKLIKTLGDPLTMEWNPFNTFNFYVEETSRNKIDSAYPDEEAAKKRIAEIKEILVNYSELDLDYAVINKESALEKHGLGISFEATWEPVEDITKKVEKIRENALLESVLTELDSGVVSDALNKFYIVFNYSNDYNPTDDSDRVGGAEEYIEREIYLDKLVSEDGSKQISSKELRKASDKLKMQKPYQRLIKLLNHNASYLYDSLGFASQPDKYGKLKNHLATGVSASADEIDQNPSAAIANDYINAIRSLKSGQNTFADTIGQLKNTFSKILGEYVGKNVAEDIAVSASDYDEEVSDNAILSELINTVRSHYDGARLKHIEREIRKYVVPAIMAIPDEENRDAVYTELLNDLKSQMDIEVDEYQDGLAKGSVAGKKDSVTPFTINQNDPGRSAKNKAAGRTIPRDSSYGVAGLPVLYDTAVKEYQGKVDQVVKELSMDGAYKKLGSNYKAKNQMIDAKYQEKFGTSRTDDYKSLANNLKDRSKGGRSDYN